MKKAGYKTYWLSNQETSGQWANVALAYANRCDYKKFTGIRQSYENLIVLMVNYCLYYMKP